MGKEFVPEIVLKIGSIEITTTVVYSLLVSTVLVVFALLVRSSLARRITGFQVIAQFIIEHLEGIMRNMFSATQSHTFLWLLPLPFS